jgi:hypothetical protein
VDGSSSSSCRMVFRSDSCGGGGVSNLIQLTLSEECSIRLRNW